jgi:hypothetical protein
MCSRSYGTSKRFVGPTVGISDSAKLPGKRGESCRRCAEICAPNSTHGLEIRLYPRLTGEQSVRSANHCETRSSSTAGFAIHL